MANVEVKIRQQSYRIACDDDQVDHVTKLSGDVTRRISSLSASMPNASDAMLLIMTTLMMEDELQQLKRAQANPTYNDDEKSQLAVSTTVEAITDYVERLATRLEKS